MTKRKKTSGQHSSPWQDPHSAREADKYENPIPSRELIEAHLEDCTAPLTHPELATVFNLREEEQIEALRRRLIAMCRDGQLIENRRNAFIPISRIELIRGRVQGHKDGYGFLIPEDGGDDLHLNPRQMRKVFDGDRVAARVAGVDNRGKQEAVIVEIIQRNTHQIVGRFYMQGEGGYVVPDNRRISHEIMIHGKNLNKAEHGQFVVVDITQQPDSRQMAVGSITEVLGDHLAPGMEIDIALRSHDIPFVFPDAVIHQTKRLADEVTEADKLHRIDIRHLPLVTIDGEDAKDFDDAVYCEFNTKTKGWRLYVAIADVSHYVGVNSPLDTEAQNRGNSVYFPEHVVPMLPEKLSNGLCSLKPKVDRLCMVCEMTISASGRISGYQFYEGVMHSHARLTYKMVGKMLDHEDEERDLLREQYRDLVPHLDALHDLYNTLRVTRNQRGAIEFETTETRIVFNAERKIQDIVPVQRNDAHKLIEECMLAANVATARFLQKHKVPALYRVHEGPSAQKLENLRTYLTELGLQLNGGNEPKPTDYLHVMEQIADREDGHLIQTMLLRSMSQAVYQPENKGHFGLAYPAYTHFTSPIRRYPDLMVHRAIRSIIRSDAIPTEDLKDVQCAAGAKPLAKADIYPYDMAALLQLGEQCSLTERRADEATRDVVDFLKCEYMRAHVGETFEGVISAVTNFGLFVQLKDLYIEGLIHVSNLSNDFYSFDPVRMRLRGERSGTQFRMGDTLSVQVSRVDLDDRKIDFQLDGVPVSGKKFKTKKSSGKRNTSDRGTAKNDGSSSPRKRKVASAKANTESSTVDSQVQASRDKKHKLLADAKKKSKKSSKKPSKRQKLNNKKSAAKASSAKAKKKSGGKSKKK